SVNAVLYTPALPDITAFLKIEEATAQGTITWFLIGYALGQLLYGPIAARFGGKKALLIGIALQIMASIGCAFTAM
ncbi:MAG TPA: MFS transporter, partial [Candidatus Berkiella sp.]|nr:MFS transporter [Candidatus Berkiella sp.]